MGWFGVVRGHSVVENSTIRQRACEFLLTFYSNNVPILNRFCDIVRYWSKIADFNLSHLLAPPLGVTPVEFNQDF